MRKISGYETEYHALPGDLSFETVEVRGIEFVIPSRTAFEYKDSRCAEFVVGAAKENDRPAIAVIEDHNGKENYVIVSRDRDISEVRDEILAAWSNGNGNPRNQDLDVVVSDYLAAVGIRWIGQHQGGRGRE